MNIQYDNNNVEKLCNDYKEAVKKLGKPVANKLHMVLQYIDAAECLMDVKNMKSFNLHSLKGDRKNTYAIYLGKKLGFRLILVPVFSENLQWKEKNENQIFNATNTVLLLEVCNHYE